METSDSRGTSVGESWSEQHTLSSSPETVAIPQSRPQLLQEDFDYVEDILFTKQVAKGAYVDKLEQEVSDFLGVRHGVTASHGTAALHLALLGLNIGTDDEVIIPSYTCAALLHATHYVGAKPVLVDIDPETLNPDSAMVRKCMTSRTKAVVLTHTFGFPADLQDIRKLGVPVIEDCAHALGANYAGRPVGSWGQIAIFSFYATKMLCAGEGGMVCTDDVQLAKRIRNLNTPEPLPKNYELRYNYKMSDLVAGLALSQFRRLGSFINRRRAIASQYSEAVAGSHLRLQQPVADSQPSYYRFVVMTSKPAVMMRHALAKGIRCDRPIYRPLHYYINGAGRTAFKNTDAVWRRAVSVPIYPDLDEGEVSRILEFLSDARQVGQ